jgi:hypothetical protein
MRKFSILQSVVTVGVSFLLCVSSSSFRGKERVSVRNVSYNSIDDLDPSTPASPLLRHIATSSSLSTLSTTSISPPVLRTFLWKGGVDTTENAITECARALDCHDAENLLSELYINENFRKIKKLDDDDGGSSSIDDLYFPHDFHCHDLLLPCDEFKIAIANALSMSDDDDDDEQDEGFNILLAVQYWTRVDELMEHYPETKSQNKNTQAASSSSSSSTCSFSSTVSSLGPISSVIASATTAVASSIASPNQSLLITPDEVREILITEILTESDFYNSLLTTTKEK